MKKRNIVLAVIFTIITFGIYGIYWYASMQNSVKSKCGLGFGGFGTVVVTFLTFGLYSIYWSYVMGERLHLCGAPKDEGILYLVLNLVGLGFISFILIQYEINKLVDAEEAAARSSWSGKVEASEINNAEAELDKMLNG